jgi:hypothetical protein
VRSEAQQFRGQLARGLPAQFFYRLGGVGEASRMTFVYLGALTLNPGTLLFGE